MASYLNRKEFLLLIEVLRGREAQYLQQLLVTDPAMSTAIAHNQALAKSLVRVVQGIKEEADSYLQE